MQDGYKIVLSQEGATIEQYRESRKLISQAVPRDEAEKGHINAMIGNCDYVIRWLETGRRPGNMRGVERLAAYQREVPVDPQLIQRYCRNTEPVRRFNENDYNRIMQVMSILSKRERQCFEMRYVGLYSEYDIAEELGITRDSVRQYIERARTKIQNFIRKPMQVELDIVV